MRAAISGGLGDIIYSLQLCKHIGVTRLYIKDIALEHNGTTFNTIKSLIEFNDIEPVPVVSDLPPMQWPKNLIFDIDLDQARRMPHRNRKHILLSFRNAFKEGYDYRQPWLKKLPGVERGLISSAINGKPFFTVMVTPRWRDHSMFSWQMEFERILPMDAPACFLGWPSDLQYFKGLLDNAELIKMLRHRITPNILDVQYFLQCSLHHYCNQNLSLAIAQGLGIDYSCEFKPGKTNCMLYTQNEVWLK